MSKYRARYDKDGKACEWQDGTLVWVRDDLRAPADPGGSAAAIFGDNIRFVSPIDGTVIEGRAAMREHCRRHDVVPNQDLQGLKPRTYGQGVTVSQQEREIRKRTMHQIVDQRYHNQLKG
jgi:ribosomal protein L35AE/L33A